MSGEESLAERGAITPERERGGIIDLQKRGIGFSPGGWGLSLRGKREEGETIMGGERCSLIHRLGLLTFPERKGNLLS